MEEDEKRGRGRIRGRGWKTGPSSGKAPEFHPDASRRQMSGIRPPGCAQPSAPSPSALAAATVTLGDLQRWRPPHPLLLFPSPLLLLPPPPIPPSPSPPPP
eukprot:8573703-Pyramimonas_sp.AAC.1